MNETKTYKYEKPKILLIDMPNACEKSLQTEGYNVTAGTFGYPIEVSPSDQIFHVSTESVKLPDYEEQEIIIVNTARTIVIPRLKNDSPGDGVKAIWQRAINGVIDPRPVAMREVRDSFGRSLQHGGIAIIMLGTPYEHDYLYGHTMYRGFHLDATVPLSNTSFLKEFENMGLTTGSGTEITFSSKYEVASLLKRGANNARYACALNPVARLRKNWVSLAENKYGECVAGALISDDPQQLVFVLPQMPDFHTIIGEFLSGCCADLRPKLFPCHEGLRWQHSDEYELPRVIELRSEIARVRTETQSKINELDAQIDAERAKNEDWYTLLSGTGDSLVAAVIRGLQKCGFVNIVDVDKQGNERNLREDLQIHDRSPILIVDVKGITGTPEDSAATQSEKHALMRAEEFKGNIKPLTIINHQRNLPPHDRNPNPYREEIVGNAMQTRLGLMTTWDIFRLLRNKERLGWSDRDVQAVFYRTGRIEPIPEHYQPLGEIVHVWKHAIGVVPGISVRVGSRIAIEVGDLFEEIDVASLKVNGVDVAEATIQSNCGISCGDTTRFREKMRVFLIVAGQSDG